MVQSIYNQYKIVKNKWGQSVKKVNINQLFNQPQNPSTLTQQQVIVLFNEVGDKPKVEETELEQILTLTSQNSFTKIEEIQLDNNNPSIAKKSLLDFIPIRILGKGSFGQVILVQDKFNGNHYAMKVINKSTVKNIENKNSALSERYLLQNMNHPFIVKLHYAFQSVNKLYLLVDFMSGGQLFFILRNQKKFSQEVAKFYAAEVLVALQYLHNRNVIYRDLKPQNILLNKQGHIKLTDFGVSKICFNKNQLAFSICGTPQYIAPEIILYKGYDQSADWFSFGSLLYDMLTGRPPFYSKNKYEILTNITTKEVPIPDNISPQAQSLLKGLFKIKPSQRLGYRNGARQIKQHQFFKGIDFNKILEQKIEPPIKFNSQINEQGFQKNLCQQQNQEGQKVKLDLALSPQAKGQGIFKNFEYNKKDQSLEIHQFLLEIQKEYNEK